MSSDREPEPHVGWWLDESALPRLIWARLMRAEDGFLVQDADGKLHLFETIFDAVTWLREDEYELFSELRLAGRVPGDAVLPKLGR